MQGVLKGGGVRLSDGTTCASVPLEMLQNFPGPGPAAFSTNPDVPENERSLFSAIRLNLFFFLPFFFFFFGTGAPAPEETEAGVA